MMDMTAACAGTADLLRNVTDDQLRGATPCEHMDVAALIAHIGVLALAFQAAGRKQFGELTDTPPTIATELDEDWRSLYASRLADLAVAWRDPAAWEGMSRAGGVDFPGDVGGMIALTEVVVHGWDLAIATGQRYDAPEDVLDAVLSHVAAFAEQGPVEGLFGAPVPVPGDAPLLDRTVALTGREPAWSS
jgi:uncharacterized protein (TIGR03086 family)